MCDSLYSSSIVHRYIKEIQNWISYISRFKFITHSKYFICCLTHIYLLDYANHALTHVGFLKITCEYILLETVFYTRKYEFELVFPFYKGWIWVNNYILVINLIKCHKSLVQISSLKFTLVPFQVKSGVRVDEKTTFASWEKKTSGIYTAKIMKR